MKELQTHIHQKVEIHAIKPIKKEVQLVATIKPKNGQKVYQLDLTTGLITEAEYKNQRIEFVDNICLLTKAVTGKIEVAKKDIDVKPNCRYWPAINPENANRHFHKLLGVKYIKPKNEAKTK